MRPLIGITASTDRARWGVWEDDVTLVPAAYVRAVRTAGGRAVVLPAGDPDAGLADVLGGQLALLRAALERELPVLAVCRGMQPSGHHQGVADAGRLTVTGRTHDGLPEALEDPSRAFVLGVQWHPEMVGTAALFDGLEAAAGLSAR